MTDVVRVHEAKTHLSALLARVEAGEEIVVARGQTPIAKLVPIRAGVERELGFLPLTIPDEFFAPLSDEELASWE